MHRGLSFMSFVSANRHTGRTLRFGQAAKNFFAKRSRQESLIFGVLFMMGFPTKIPPRREHSRWGLGWFSRILMGLSGDALVFEKESEDFWIADDGLALVDSDRIGGSEDGDCFELSRSINGKACDVVSFKLDFGNEEVGVIEGSFEAFCSDDVAVGYECHTKKTYPYYEGYPDGAGEVGFFDCGVDAQDEGKADHGQPEIG